jgi:hypothetical protein
MYPPVAGASVARTFSGDYICRNEACEVVYRIFVIIYKQDSAYIKVYNYEIFEVDSSNKPSGMKCSSVNWYSHIKMHEAAFQ